MKERFRNRILVFGAIGIASACGGDSTGPNPVTSGRSPSVFISGVTTDTAGAVHADPLVIEVHSASGAVLADSMVHVRMDGLVAEKPTGPGLSNEFNMQTDSRGRIALLTHFGYHTPRARIFLYDTPMGPAVDSLELTIRPGNAAQVIMSADTAVMVGATETLVAHVADAHGNVRAEAVSLRALDGGLSVNGSTITGATIGRARVEGAFGAFRDTANVSVVPNTRITAYQFNTLPDETDIYSMNADGSDRKTIFHSESTTDASFAFGVDSTQLIHQVQGFVNSFLYSVDLKTGASHRLLPVSAQMAYELWPVRSFNKQWVYFTGGPENSLSIYRVHPDGTGIANVGPLPGSSFPAPAPDDETMAFIRDGDLNTMNVSIGIGRDFAIPARTVHWTPDGKSMIIATPDGGFAVVDPVAGVSHPVPTTAHNYARDFDVSPDGKYIVATEQYGRVTFIDVATGLEMPVAATQIVVHPIYGSFN